MTDTIRQTPLNTIKVMVQHEYGHTAAAVTTPTPQRHFSSRIPTKPIISSDYFTQRQGSSLSIDLQKPHTKILPYKIPTGTTVSNTLKGLVSQIAPQNYKDNTIFKTRMAHPSGSILGERMQKQLSLLEQQSTKTIEIEHQSKEGLDLLK